MLILDKSVSEATLWSLAEESILSKMTVLFTVQKFKFCVNLQGKTFNRLTQANGDQFISWGQFDIQYSILVTKCLTRVTKVNTHIRYWSLLLQWSFFLTKNYLSISTFFCTLLSQKVFFFSPSQVTQFIAGIWGYVGRN